MKNFTPEDLIKLRSDKNLSQQEVADFVGVSQKAYSSWEKGTSKPKHDRVSKLNELFKNKSSNSSFVPLISLDVAAGFGTDNFSIQEKDIQQEYLVPDFNGIDFMIRVKGSSMYPKYSSGDIVACRIIKESQFIQWHKPYVIATREQGLLCKRLMESDKKDHLRAVSDNKEYPPFDIPKKEIAGIALIVGTIRLE